MALFIKNQRPGRVSGSTQTLVDQWIRVDRAIDTLPTTAQEAIFTVANGNVLVKLIYGEVTTIIQTQANNLSVIATPTTGTAGNLATTLNISADEVGTFYLVEGDGSALVGVAAAGSFFVAGTPVPMIIPPGTIDILTSATNTGAIRWTLFYLPLQDNAVVTSTAV